jgi:hypothetical protein
MLSPSSPRKGEALDNRELIIPFKNLNKKTYFKTIEHMIHLTP